MLRMLLHKPWSIHRCLQRMGMLVWIGRRMHGGLRTVRLWLAIGSMLCCT